MYKTCPKCGYERKPTDTVPKNQCPACGLFFDKWMKQRFRNEPQADRLKPSKQRPSKLRIDWPGLKAILTGYQSPQEQWVLIGRLVLLVILAVWGAQFIWMDHTRLDGGLPEINYSFLHGVNLVFHEAGHVIFSVLGRFMGVLGGSLGQLIMPMVVIIALLRHGDPFGGAVGLWWLGQSLMDLAPYIHDAPHGRMLLLGGVTGDDAPGYHDWTNILGGMGALDAGPPLATFVDAMGVLVMLTALGWGAYVLIRNWR